MLIPSKKLGYAGALDNDHEDLKEAFDIIAHANYLQPFQDVNNELDHGTACGVWPTQVPFDQTKAFVASTAKEFETLCIAALKASPEGMIVIFEVEEESFIAQCEADAKAGCKNLKAAMEKLAPIKVCDGFECSGMTSRKMTEQELFEYNKKIKEKRCVELVAKNKIARLQKIENQKKIRAQLIKQRNERA